MVIPSDISQHQFIFIGGLHRSGTSLLFRILRDHPQISGFQNTGVPEDEGGHLQTVYTRPKFLGRAGFFALHPDAHQTETSPLTTKANRQKLWDDWRLYWNQEAKYLLEKSPANILLTRFLQAMFPNSYFIILTRHPIAVTLATRKWFWHYEWQRHRIDLLMANWVKAHDYLQADIPYLKRVLVLQYEMLVNAPEMILGQVYQFLNIDPYPHTEVIQSSINESYFQEWEKLQNSLLFGWLIQHMVTKYNRQIQALGYDLVN